MKPSFLVNCGRLETMQSVASRGKKALNPRTHKWQVIDKNAIYEIRNVKSFTSDDGNSYTTADLYADLDLKSIAKEKGLIV